MRSKLVFFISMTLLGCCFIIPSCKHHPKKKTSESSQDLEKEKIIKIAEEIATKEYGSIIKNELPLRARLVGDSVWVQGWSKKEALEKKVLFDAGYLAGIIGKEWDKKFPDLGSGFTFWSGDEGELEGVQVSFRIGATSDNKHIWNAAMVSFSHKEELRPRKDDQRVKDIVALIKKTWGWLFHSRSLNDVISQHRSKFAISLKAMKKKLILHFIFVVTFCACGSKDHNLDSVISKLDTVDFGGLKNLFINFISKGGRERSSIYFVAVHNRDCSPYAVEVDDRKGTILDINDSLAINSCGGEILSRNEIESAIRRYLEYKVCVLFVDEQGNVYINPDKQERPVLLRKAPNNEPGDFKEFKHYKGNWYVRNTAQITEKLNDPI